METVLVIETAMYVSVSTGWVIEVIVTGSHVTINLHPVGHIFQGMSWHFPCNEFEQAGHLRDTLVAAVGAKRV